MKTLTIALPDDEFEFYQHAWDKLAEAVLTDDERGQRRTGRSVLFRAVCTAGVINFDETVRLLKMLKEMKRL